jgi:hypothetical protein
MPRSGRLKPHAARVYQHHDMRAHSKLNDCAYVTQTTADNNVALCPFARLLKAHRLLGVGAEIK